MMEGKIKRTQDSDRGSCANCGKEVLYVYYRIGAPAEATRACSRRCFLGAERMEQMEEQAWFEDLAERPDSEQIAQDRRQA